MFNTQVEMAEALGCTQQGVSYLMKAKTVSPEMAIAIDRATGGAVSRFDLRPDLEEAFTRKEGEAA
jgi:DNA-binding transcriptional regulator YdaS (Cro superfamily)